VVWTTVTGRRIAMAGHNNLRLHFRGADDGGIEVVNFEPQQHAVAIGLIIRITNWPMVMVDLKAVELEN
jgi:hypothetical protein